MIVATSRLPIWDANLYLKFVDARLRPALDLMGRLDPANAARPGHAIYDLGCGAGNITRILAERFPGPPVIGVDSSEEMLAKARSQTADKHVSFAKGDLAEFKPDVPPGILYSNAAYQWVENHIDLLPRAAETAAVGRAARHPDAAQSRSALARTDEEGGRDGPVARQARQGGRHPHRVGAGALLRRAEAACARTWKSGNRSTSSR